MKFSPQHILYVSILIFINSSCTRVFYSPSNAVSPGLIEKGETILSGNIIQSETEGYSVEIAHSPIKNLGILIRTESHAIKYDLGIVTDQINNVVAPIYRIVPRKMRQTRNTLGIGYYSNLINGFQFQLFSSASIGSFQDGSFKGKMVKYAVHPSILLTLNKFQLGLHGSLNKLIYGNLINDLQILNRSQREYILTNSKHSIGEVFISGKFKLDKISLYCQTGISRNLKNPNFKQANSNLTLGVSLNINSIFKEL